MNNSMTQSEVFQLEGRSKSDRKIRTDLNSDAVNEISCELLADAFVLYLKTKNFHWHMSGSH